MKTIDHLDNGIETEMKRVILWQYDHAERLVRVVMDIFKAFFDASTKNFWDGYAAKINIATSSSVDAFSLGIWGRLLVVGRPFVEYDGASHAISDAFYRRILVGRFQLARSDASSRAYHAFIAYVFDGKVTVAHDCDMGLSFAWCGDATPSTTADKEMKAAVEQKSDLIFIYPAGVKRNEESNDAIFGFSEQATFSGSGSSEYQTVKTSVDVTVYAAAGTVLPAGAKFTYDGVTYKTSAAKTIPTGKTNMVVRFVSETGMAADAHRFVPSYAVSRKTGSGTTQPGEITKSDGTALAAAITSCVNYARSHTDFFIGNFQNEAGTNADAATLSWDRFRAEGSV